MADSVLYRTNSYLPMPSIAQPATESWLLWADGKAILSTWSRVEIAEEMAARDSGIFNMDEARSTLPTVLSCGLTRPTRSCASGARVVS